MSEKSPSAYLRNLRAKANAAGNYGGTAAETPASLGVRDCPNCGAGRAASDGLTRCAYCGFEFIATTLSDGIHLSSGDNS